MQHKRQSKSRPRRGKRGRGTLLPAVAAPPRTARSLLAFSKAYLLAETVGGSGASYAFRLNSVYDPDSSGIGTTATGFTQWTNFYRNYRVKRVTVRLEGVISGGSSAGACGEIVLAPVALQAVIPSNAYLWKLIPGAQHKVIAPATAGGVNVVNFSRTFDLAKVLSISDMEYKSDFDFTGSVSSNPGREAFLMVCVIGIGVTSPLTLSYTIALTYDVEWFNPIPLQ